MPRVSNNTERKCCVREANVEDGFKVTVYPALMDLEMEINNIICAVKEMHSRFVGDKYIRQRMELCKETLLGNLVLDVANIVERQVDIVKKAKEEMLAELQSKYREMAVLIDKQVKRVFPTADQRHDNFVQRRLEDSVIEYNRKAEEARLRQCEFEKKKIFYRVYQKVSDKFNPGEESVNAADSEALSVRSDVSGEPVEVKFKSNPFQVANPVATLSEQSTRIIPDQPLIPEPSLTGGKGPVLEAKLSANSDLAVSDKELEEIAKNTKLKISEEVQVEGIQQFDHIWHLGKLEENKYLVSGYAQQTSLVGKMIKDDNSYSIFNIKSRSINEFGRAEIQLSLQYGCG